MRSVTVTFAEKLSCLMVKIAFFEETMNSCRIILGKSFYSAEIKFDCQKNYYSEKYILIDIYMVFSMME